MDGLQLRDEAVQERIRLAEEFLDPGKHDPSVPLPILLTRAENPRARRFASPFHSIFAGLIAPSAIVPISSLCSIEECDV